MGIIKLRELWCEGAARRSLWDVSFHQVLVWSL